MCTLSFLIVYCQFKKEDELIKTSVEVANNSDLSNRCKKELLREKIDTFVHIDLIMILE